MPPSIAAWTSDPHLKRLFLKYNREFHGNALPTSCVVRWASERELRKEAQWTGKRKAPIGLFYYGAKDVEEAKRGHFLPIILLNIQMRKLRWWSVVKLTLHHEMCHLASKGRDNHGPAFHRRMRQLALTSAFNHIW